MIDLHCHIVPGFDDGPSNLEESMKMVDMAHKDGIRTMVATSHRNHTMDFKPTESYEDAFQKLKEASAEKYPDMKIYTGAELYIRENYIKLLESKPYDFTINKTQYVLIEFQRDVDYNRVMDVVYELKIRGYRPILAHIEMYPELLENESGLKDLRAEGAYLQITGSSLIGKQGRDMMNKLRKLVKENYIDFICSDGHSAERRRPMLLKAYRMVASDCSEEVADRIFKKNPETVVQGNVLKPMTIKSADKKAVKFLFKRKALVAVALLALLLGAFTLGSRDEVVPVDDENSVKDESAEDGKVEPADNGVDEDGKEDTEVAKEGDAKSSDDNNVKDSQNSGDLDKADSNKTPDAVEQSESPQSTQKTNKDTVTKPSETQSNQPSARSQADIEQDYRARLNGLESQYQGLIGSAMSNIETAVSENDMAAANGYIGELSGLEASADGAVYGLLYEMQNELESYGYNTYSVESFRSEYQQKKAATKGSYGNP